jgi:hypothetical protein
LQRSGKQRERKTLAVVVAAVKHGAEQGGRILRSLQTGIGWEGIAGVFPQVLRRRNASGCG